MKLFLPIQEKGPVTSIGIADSLLIQKWPLWNEVFQHRQILNLLRLNQEDYRWFQMVYVILWLNHHPSPGRLKKRYDHSSKWLVLGRLWEGGSLVLCEIGEIERKFSTILLLGKLYLDRGRGGIQGGVRAWEVGKFNPGICFRAQITYGRDILWQRPLGANQPTKKRTVYLIAPRIIGRYVKIAWQDF